MEIIHLLYAGGATGFIITLLFAAWIIIYIPAVLIALFPLLGKNNKVYTAGSIVVFLICLFCTLKAVDSTRITNLSGKGLSEAYLALCDHFEQQINA